MEVGGNSNCRSCSYRGISFKFQYCPCRLIPRSVPVHPCAPNSQASLSYLSWKATQGMSFMHPLASA